MIYLRCQCQKQIPISAYKVIKNGITLECECGIKREVNLKFLETRIREPKNSEKDNKILLKIITEIKMKGLDL